MSTLDFILEKYYWNLQFELFFFVRAWNNSMTKAFHWKTKQEKNVLFFGKNESSQKYGKISMGLYLWDHY